MAQTKRNPRPKSKANADACQEILTLAEAAAYLRVAEQQLLGMVERADLPGRKVGTEWHFLRPALQDWLPAPSRTKKGMLAHIGANKDDPTCGHGRGNLPARRRAVSKED